VKLPTSKRYQLVMKQARTRVQVMHLQASDDATKCGPILCNGLRGTKHPWRGVERLTVALPAGSVWCASCLKKAKAR
jgi:hypothetical protein